MKQRPYVVESRERLISILNSFGEVFKVVDSLAMRCVIKLNVGTGLVGHNPTDRPRITENIIKE